MKIIMYLQNIISIHPILLDPKCDKVLKDELNMDSSNKISFLNKNARKQRQGQFNTYKWNMGMYGAHINVGYII